MSASAYGGYDATKGDFSHDYMSQYSDTNSQRSYTVYDPPTDDPENRDNYNTYTNKPAQESPYNNAESVRSAYSYGSAYTGSYAGSEYKSSSEASSFYSWQDDSNPSPTSPGSAYSATEPVETTTSGSSANFGKLSSSSNSLQTIKHPRSVVMPDDNSKYAVSTRASAGSGTSESETDMRRREAFHPYFEIKSNLTNILKDFTDMDSPYKKNVAAYKNQASNINAQSGQQPEPIALSKQRDWNNEFQELLDRRAKMDKYEKAADFDESIDVYERLSNLEKDFVYAATLYGRIIISEQHQEIKTLKPVPMGGVAGGLKYVVNGILFKFVKDDTKLKLYGSDEFAMKAASHEKNGLVSLYHCGIQELRIPLMAYIDYRGHRLMAISILPIDRNTLVYGSNDGGTNVHMDDPKFNELMRLAGQRLNLKQHIVGADKNGMGGKMIYGPADIEGHIGHDGRYYLLDFARLAPPEPVTSASAPGQFLYQLLRLELVRTNLTPLSSDAYSWIGRIDGPVHNAEVRKVYKHLLEDIIPDFAEFLDANPTSLDNIEEFIYNLHSHGINVRQLGYLRAKVTNEPIKNKILAEAISRVIKNQLRYMFRQEMIVSGTSDEAYRKLTVNFLNLVFGGVNQNFTQLYWNDVIKNDLQVKFKRILAPNENIDLYEVCVKKLGIVFVERLSTVCGIRFQKSAIKSMSEGIAGFRLVDPDLKDLESVVTRLNMIDYSDGMALFYKAKSMEQDVERASQLRLLTMARNRLRAARYSMCSTEEAIYYNAIVEQFVAKLQKQNSVAEREAALLSAEQSFDKLLEMRTYIQHDIIISKAKCIRARAKLNSDQSISLPLYETAIQNIKHAMQIERSDMALYVMAKTLLSRWRIQHANEDLQEAERLMLDAHERDPASAAYAWGLAQILLEKHAEQVLGFTVIDRLTNQPILTNETEEDCQHRKQIVQRIGQLMDIAVKTFPKLYTAKIMQKLNAQWPPQSVLIWTFWGWAQYSPGTVEALFARIKDTESLKLAKCKFIDESLIDLMAAMPKMNRLELNYSRDYHYKPLPAELIKKLVADISDRLTYLGLAGSSVTRSCLDGPSFSQLTKLDVTHCADFDILAIRMPNLRSLKLVGCNNVTDESLSSFVGSTPNLTLLYLPDSITRDGFTRTLLQCPKLRALRAPPSTTEDDMRMAAERLPDLAKLDLLGCMAITNDFIDSLNRICHRISKVRDARGVPHLFSGVGPVRISTRKLMLGNQNVLDVTFNGEAETQIRVEKIAAPNPTFPTKWVIKANPGNKNARFKQYGDFGVVQNAELFTIQRTTHMAMLKFSFTTSPTVFQFHGPMNNFTNNTYQLYGHEVRISGLIQNDTINVVVGGPNDPIARIKQTNPHMLWMELEASSLNINMIIAVLVICLNKDLK